MKDVMLIGGVVVAFASMFVGAFVPSAMSVAAVGVCACLYGAVRA